MAGMLSAVRLLAFGLVALVGLIVLEGTGHLSDPTVRDTLTSIAVAALTGGAAISAPDHTHPAATAVPIADQAAAGDNLGELGTLMTPGSVPPDQPDKGSP